MNLARISYFIFVALAVVFLAFVAGYGSNYFQLFKGGLLNDAMLAAQSMYAQQTAYKDPYQSARWRRQRDPRTGVVTHLPTQALQGHTLYTSGHAPAAMLLDMDGTEVWRWELPFDEAWPTADHLDNVALPANIFWRKAYAYPNGDLLAIYDGEGVTPSGHGLVKIDRDSNLIWKYSESVHHDVQLGEDGNIYTLIYDIEKQPVRLEQDPSIKNYKWRRQVHGKLEPPILADSVAILDPNGRELNRINVPDALVNSQWAWLLNSVTPNRLGDYFHTNTVQPIDSRTAAAHDFAQPGQILISLRELSTVVVLDPDTKEAVWALRGPWIGQHDSELLPNGHMLIYDNKGDISSRYGISRIVELDPLTQEIVWQYAGSPDVGFTSQVRGSQQRLPNGNTLITSSGQGRLFEVTEDGEIAWDFRNPVRGGDNDEYVPVLMWGQRYENGSLNFLP